MDAIAEIHAHIDWHFEEYLDEIRVHLMTEALERTNWVQTQAAELLGMSFRSFRYYAKKAGLTGKRARNQSEREVEAAETPAQG